MASSLRTGLLSRQTVLRSRPRFPLEQCFSLLRIGSAAAHTANGRSSSQTRHHSTFRKDQDELNSDLAGLDVTLSSDDILAMTGGVGEGLRGEPFVRDVADGEEPSMDSLFAGPPSKNYARTVPLSPSYFEPQPLFVDRYLQLRELLRKYGHLPRLPANQVEQVPWRTLRHYRNTTDEKIRGPLYNQCLSIIKHLHSIHPALKPAGVPELVKEFTRPVNFYENIRPTPVLDRFGRATGVGRRKTSVARAWVVEGTGEILVNGKGLNASFGRIHDRESATWALRATNRTDKYNVWALVEGGGTTGQAEALTLAVAKALVVHEPALKTALRKAGCITRDPRRVERKKPGHLKARKSPAWVKR